MRSRTDVDPDHAAVGEPAAATDPSTGRVVAYTLFADHRLHAYDGNSTWRVTGDRLSGRPGVLATDSGHQIFIVDLDRRMRFVVWNGSTFSDWQIL